MRLIDTETTNMSKVNTFNEYQYEKELKFLVYNMILELKSLLVIIC